MAHLHGHVRSSRLVCTTTSCISGPTLRTEMRSNVVSLLPSPMRRRQQAVARMHAWAPCHGRHAPSSSRARSNHARVANSSVPGDGGMDKTIGTSLPAPRQQPQKQKHWELGFEKSLWTLIEVLAVFGSAAGAIAALLGVGPLTWALGAPIALPLLSLMATLSRQTLLREVGALCVNGVC